MTKVIFVACLFFPVLLFAQAKKPQPKARAKTGSLTTVSIDRGKTVYSQFCLSCHQADGSGVPNMNPPLIKTKWVLGPKTVLIQQVLKGSQGKVEIDGDTFHNTMPAQAQLTDQQIADVLSFVRNSFGNKASMVTPAEVKVVRAKTK
ncbi:c-type cytochrome [Flavisolibacter nicotianae]|uniref:c-type cytochrome n=1 Tax=Flavisolibacter nicotianae TaxID=2364882 RepID=UPI000EAC6253|nr:cytochrome c [Flavisolibacter nicotianae]